MVATKEQLQSKWIQCYESMLEAWHILSEARNYYPCVNEDQYSPFRISPAYPLVLGLDAALPSNPNAMFGNRICATNYALSNAYCVGWNPA